MKTKWLSKGNIVTIVLLGVLGYTQGPTIVKNFRYEGQSLEAKSRTAILSDGSSKAVFFPPKRGKAIAIFWASWCGPCKLEMKRLSSSVKQGKIPSDKIFAINSFESASIARKFAMQSGHPFIFISDQELGHKLEISSTPTTLFLEDGVVTSRSSGASLIGIWKAEFFF